MGFEAVGLSSTPWEVARSFAAMLQLANARKLDICRHADLQPGAACCVDRGGARQGI